MKALVIGGERHGEWIDGLFEGSRMWVDIEHATRHVLRKLTWNVQDARNGNVLEAYVIYVAVHEQLQGQDEPATVQALLQALTMNEFARAHGDKQEMPHEPAAVERAATLFGVDERGTTPRQP
jgi:hypothetical protein